MQRFDSPALELDVLEEMEQCCGSLGLSVKLETLL